MTKDGFELVFEVRVFGHLLLGHGDGAAFAVAIQIDITLQQEEWV